MLGDRGDGKCMFIYLFITYRQQRFFDAHKLFITTQLSHTGGEGSLTQWVHCEFVVSFETIRPVITQQVCGGFF